MDNSKSNSKSAVTELIDDLVSGRIIADIEARLAAVDAPEPDMIVIRSCIFNMSHNPKYMEFSKISHEHPYYQAKDRFMDFMKSGCMNLGTLMDYPNDEYVSKYIKLYNATTRFNKWDLLEPSESFTDNQNATIELMRVIREWVHLGDLEQLISIIEPTIQARARRMFPRASDEEINMWTSSVASNRITSISIAVGRLTIPTSTAMRDLREKNVKWAAELYGPDHLWVRYLGYLYNCGRANATNDLLLCRKQLDFIIESFARHSSLFSVQDTIFFFSRLGDRAGAIQFLTEHYDFMSNLHTTMKVLSRTPRNAHCIELLIILLDGHELAARLKEDFFNELTYMSMLRQSKKMCVQRVFARAQSGEHPEISCVICLNDYDVGDEVVMCATCFVYVAHRLCGMPSEPLRSCPLCRATW